MPRHTHIVKVHHLSLAFPTRHDQDPKPVLKDIDFGIRDGEILGLIGNSGSGKTMTAMAIAGLLPEGAVAEWSRLNRCPLPTEAELLSVEKNLEIGCWYLARGLERYRGYRYGVEMALAWYNAGDARVKRWKPDKPDGDFVSRIDISGTALYVKKITSRYHKYLAAAAAGKGK